MKEVIIMAIKEENDRQLKNMCRRIITERNKQGMSLNELSSKSEIPLDILIKLENEIVTDRFDTNMFLVLCKLFNIRPSQFFED